MDQNWQLKKAKRLIELAKETKADIETLILDKFDSIEEFRELEKKLKEGTDIKVSNPNKKLNFKSISGSYFGEEIKEIKTDKYKEKKRRRIQDKTMKPQECWYCIEDSKQELVIARGNYSYLCLPYIGRLNDSHCSIIPYSHSKEFETAALEEVRNFKKCLVRLAHKQRKKYIFTETCLKNTRHIFVDCVSIPLEVEHQPVFKLSMLESDKKWATHEKILINRAPRGFEYFMVEYDFDKIYTRLIEDEHLFFEFGRSIIANLLELEYHQWHNNCTEKSESNAFKSQFDEFDWTKMLQ